MRKKVTIITVDNDDVLYGKRTDQTDSKLLSVYYFLLPKGVSFFEKNLLNLET